MDKQGGGREERAGALERETERGRARRDWGVAACLSAGFGELGVPAQGDQRDVVAADRRRARRTVRQDLRDHLRGVVACLGGRPQVAVQVVVAQLLAGQVAAPDPASVNASSASEGPSPRWPWTASAQPLIIGPVVPSRSVTRRAG